uniref:Tankyrase 1-binding protein C-terminal domain-containing protein n=1 Tax=Denticeps clupeoides TaxID=299321 RepID=A0AAY4DIW2_9TELE
MEYLGDKLSVAQSQMAGWVGNVRRSLQGALNFVSTNVERGGAVAAAGRSKESGGFKRAASLRGLASRSRESFRRFSLRSQQRLSLRRRTASPTTPTAEQLKQCVKGPEDVKDAGPVAQESDSQYGTWDPPPQRVLGACRRGNAHVRVFVGQTSTALLDSSALRSRVQLSKKRSRRTPPSRPGRHSAALPSVPGEAQDWRFKDSTEEKPEPGLQEESDSESPSGGTDPRTPATSSTQRVALFPGVDPSALKAQLKKRGDSDGQSDGSAPSSTSRSPRSPFLPRASCVLPLSPIKKQFSPEP